MPTKVQLLKKFHEEGVESFSIWETKRLKRMITRDVIKENNSASAK
jgi:hypothetical protein